MTSWGVFLAVGVGSYLMRVVPLLVGARVDWTPRTERAVQHAGIAAIVALITSATIHAGADATTPVAVLAVLVGVIVAVRGGSMLRTVVVGTGVFVALDLAVDLAAGVLDRFTG